MSQAVAIKEAALKQSFQELFFERLKKVMKSVLSGDNKVRALNGWVTAVLI